MSSSRDLYALPSAMSISTLRTSSSYDGSASEMSSKDTNAPSSIRNRPNNNGEAPGRRRTRVVTLACLNRRCQRE